MSVVEGVLIMNADLITICSNRYATGTQMPN